MPFGIMELMALGPKLAELMPKAREAVDAVDEVIAAAEVVMSETSGKESWQRLAIATSRLKMIREQLPDLPK